MCVVSPSNCSSSRMSTRHDVSSLSCASSKVAEDNLEILVRVRPSGEAGPPNLEAKTRHNIYFSAHGADF